MSKRAKRSNAMSREAKKLTAEEIADIRYQLADDTWHRRASNAQTQIFQLEALHDCLFERVDKSQDEHTASLLELATNVVKDLRRELYGEDMSP